MVSVFWGNKDEFMKIGDCTSDEVLTIINDFLKNKDIEAPYIRYWTENGVTYYDYGDWSRFCYSVPFYISF